MQNIDDRITCGITCFLTVCKTTPYVRSDIKTETWKHTNNDLTVCKALHHGITVPVSVCYTMLNEDSFKCEASGLGFILCSTSESLLTTIEFSCRTYLLGTEGLARTRRGRQGMCLQMPGDATAYRWWRSRTQLQDKKQQLLEREACGQDRLQTRDLDICRDEAVTRDGTWVCS